jgi:hypothetical protein
MRPVIALLILGSIATSASAAGTDIHGLVDGETGHTVVSEQQSQLSRRPISGAFSRATDTSAVALPDSVIGKRRSSWNKNSSNLV